MSYVSDIVTTPADAVRPEKPLPGDICIASAEIGKRFADVIDFEVWDGARWIHSSERERPHDAETRLRNGRLYQKVKSRG